MHLTILTGASRGLGKALAEQLLARGHHVLALSRRPAALAVPPGAQLTPWAVDLADATPVAQQLALWLAALDASRVASATLINNAGVVSQLAPLSGVAADDLVNARQTSGTSSCPSACAGCCWCTRRRCWTRRTTPGSSACPRPGSFRWTLR